MTSSLSFVAKPIRMADSKTFAIIAVHMRHIFILTREVYGLIGWHPRFLSLSLSFSLTLSIVT